MARTPFDPIVKRAALFSALTGLRHSDIQKLTWAEIEEFNGGYRLNFTQQKTKGVEYMPISKQAYQLCGERKDDELLVFAGLPDPSWISKPLERWIKQAGITKHITFHCFSIRSLPCSWQAAPTSIPSANCLVIPTSKPPRSMQVRPEWSLNKYFFSKKLGLGSI